MTVNATTVSAGAALRVLQAGWDAQEAGGLRVSWMLHGRPGVGKTELVQSLAQSRGADLFDLRLTTIEPQDLRGLPYFDHDAQKTVWYRPEDLPDDPHRPAILFLDELTAAAPALQPTVYGLLQERRVGRHRLPDSVFLVAAGNAVEDGAIAYEMGTALSDRLVHLAVQADPQDWLSGYAVDAGLDPSVTAFIRARPDLLDTSEDAIRRGNLIACTPRSWARVSQIVQTVPDRAMRNIMIAGTVGEVAAAEFALVADEIVANLNLQELMAASRHARAPLYPEGLHGLTALVYALVAEARPDTLPTIIEIMADIRTLSGPGQGGLPLSDLTSFGFEILIRRALDKGWQQAFAASDAYAAYAKSRAEAGLP